MGRPLLDLILPPLCLFCGEAIDSGDLCSVCERLLIAQWPSQTVACRRCGLPRPALLPVTPSESEARQTDHTAAAEASANRTAEDVAVEDDPEQPCGHCPPRPFPFDSVTVLGGYRGILREAIVATKRATHAALASSLGQRLARNVAAASFPAPLDSVTFIPCHRWRRMIRGGASGAQRMATAIARELDLPVAALLTARRQVQKQSLLPPGQRIQNVADAFALQEPARRRLRRLWGCHKSFLPVTRPAMVADPAVADQPLIGRHILLVDDVLTTGATAAEATRVLKRAGAATVHLAVVARALA